MFNLVGTNCIKYIRKIKIKIVKKKYNNKFPRSTSWKLISITSLTFNSHTSHQFNLRRLSSKLFNPLTYWITSDYMNVGKVSPHRVISTRLPNELEIVLAFNSNNCSKCFIINTIWLQLGTQLRLNFLEIVDFIQCDGRKEM